MPIPDYQTLMRPVLHLAAEGETNVAAIAGPLADAFALTPDERAELLPSGRQIKLHNRTQWAKFYLGKAGLIASPARCRFAATEAGRRALRHTAPDRIVSDYQLPRKPRDPAKRRWKSVGVCALAYDTRL